MQEEHRIEECIEYLTQIFTSWDGTEQRVALREHPRRSLSYRYTGSNTKKSTYLRAMAFSQQNVQTEFPLWHYISPLKATLYKSQSQIQIDKETVWGYRGAIGCMLWQSDDGGSEYFKILEVTGDGKLRLASQATNDWDADSTFCVPVVMGILAKEDNYTNFTASAANLNINVEVIPQATGITLPNSLNEWNYKRIVFDDSTNARPEYSGLELFMAQPSWVKDDEVSFARNANRLDGNVGRFYYDLKSKTTTLSRTLSYVACTKEYVNFLQRFFYRCQGRLKPFWIPSWTTDFELATDADVGDAVLFVKFCLDYRFYATQQRRRDIIAFFNDGTVELVKIAGFSVNDDRTKGKVYLKSSIKKKWKRQDIRMICFLLKVRHASDAMTVAYETAQSAEIDFAIQEVDD